MWTSAETGSTSTFHQRRESNVICVDNVPHNVNRANSAVSRVNRFRLISPKRSQTKRLLLCTGHNASHSEVEFGSVSPLEHATPPPVVIRSERADTNLQLTPCSEDLDAVQRKDSTQTPTVCPFLLGLQTVSSSSLKSWT